MTTTKTKKAPRTTTAKRGAKTAAHVVPKPAEQFRRRMLAETELSRRVHCQTTPHAARLGNLHFHHVEERLDVGEPARTDRTVTWPRWL